MIEIEHKWLNQTEGPVEIIIYVYSKRRKKDMMKALHKLELGSIEIAKTIHGIRVFDLNFKVSLPDANYPISGENCDAAIIDRCVFLEHPDMEDVIKANSAWIYMDQSMSKVLDRVKGLIRDHLQAKINAGRKPWEVQDGKAM